MTDLASHKTAGGFTNAVVFWLLLAMSVAAFAPCVLLPEWRELQALRVVEEAEQSRVVRMEKRIEHERRRVAAMRGDPAVIERLARRDLGFHGPGELAVPVGGGSSVAPSRLVVENPSAIVQADLPLEAVAMGTVWPDLEYDLVFCDPRTRPLILTMSVGLAGAAFVLFGRGRSPQSE